MRYSLVKVLLTMSPFRPSFPMRLHPFPCSPRTVSPLSTAFLPRAKPRGAPASTVSPLSTAFTPNRPLTPLSTAFTQTDRGGGDPDLQTFRPSDPQPLFCSRLMPSFHTVGALVLCFAPSSPFAFNRLPPLFAKQPGKVSSPALTRGCRVQQSQPLTWGIRLELATLFRHTGAGLPSPIPPYWTKYAHRIQSSYPRGLGGRHTRHLAALSVSSRRRYGERCHHPLCLLQN